MPTRNIGGAVQAHRVAVLIFFILFSSLNIIICAGNLLSDGSCSCSPWSGNQGSCCSGSAGNFCGSAFSKKQCGDATPVCCTSDFGSACCKVGEACSPGCRNTLKGSCGCLSQPSLDSVGWNRTHALRQLSFSAAAQCAANDIVRWNCTACVGKPLQEVAVVQNNSHLAFTAWDDAEKSIVVVLRGSLSIQDWLNNLNYFKTPAYGDLNCSDCNVHRGFLEAFQSLEPGILKGVRDLSKTHPDFKTIMVTGHSLGAAMAAHTAIALKLVHGFEKISMPVYTFGQPRVGDAAFASWFHRIFPNWLRSVHWNDPVPHLAPASFGFHHVGREIWWTEKSMPGEAIVCDGQGEDPNCSASIVTAMVFTDHWYYLGKKVVQCAAF